VKCADCKFWKAKDGGTFDDGVGECRRYAARPLIADDADAEPKSPFVAWPLTLDDQFCGDYEPRRETQSFV
jgi:hypothetical protein